MPRRQTDIPPSLPYKPNSANAAVRWGSAPPLPGINRKNLFRASWSGPVGESSSDMLGLDAVEAGASGASDPATPQQRQRPDTGDGRRREKDRRFTTANAFERGLRKFASEDDISLPRMVLDSPTSSTSSAPNGPYNFSAKVLRENRRLLSYELAAMEAEVLPLVHSPVEKFAIDARFVANVQLTTEEEELMRHVQEMRAQLSRLHLQSESKVKVLQVHENVYKNLCLELDWGTSKQLQHRKIELQKRKNNLRERHEKAVNYTHSLELMLKRMGEEKRNAKTAHSHLREDVERVDMGIQEAMVKFTENNNAKELVQDKMLESLEKFERTQEEQRKEIDFLRKTVASIKKRKTFEKSQLLKEKTIVLQLERENLDKLKESAKDKQMEITSMTLYTTVQKKEALMSTMEMYVKSIKERTGISEPKDIVCRMLDRHKITMKMELQSMRAQARLDDLTRERDTLIRQKNALEFSGQASTTYRRSVIDELDARMTAASRRLRMAIYHHVQSSELLAALRSGIESLSNNVNAAMPNRSALHSGTTTRSSIPHIDNLTSSPSPSATTPAPLKPPAPHSSQTPIPPSPSTSLPLPLPLPLSPHPSNSSSPCPPPSTPPPPAPTPPAPNPSRTGTQVGPPRGPRQSIIISEELVPSLRDETCVQLDSIQDRLVKIVEATAVALAASEGQGPDKMLHVSSGPEDVYLNTRRVTLLGPDMRFDKAPFNVRINFQAFPMDDHGMPKGVSDGEAESLEEEELCEVDSSHREFLLHPPPGRRDRATQRAQEGDSDNTGLDKNAWRRNMHAALHGPKKELKKKVKIGGTLVALKEGTDSNAHHHPPTSGVPSRPSSSTGTRNSGR